MRNAPSQVNFNQQVQQKLKQMLEIYRHLSSDCDHNNPQFNQYCVALEQHCQDLLELGKISNFPAWVELLTVINQVISQSNDDYKNTVGLIINQIQHSAKLIANGQRKNLKISPKIEQIYDQQKLNKYQSEQTESDLELSNLFDQKVKKNLNVSDNQNQEVQAVTNKNSIPQNSSKADQDLFDLFGEDFDFDESLEKETIIFPLEDEKSNQANNELSQLFGENFGFDDEQTIIQSTPFYVEKGTELGKKNKENQPEQSSQSQSNYHSLKTADEPSFSQFLQTEFALEEENKRANKNVIDHQINQNQSLNGDDNDDDELNQFLEEDFLAQYQVEDNVVTDFEANGVDELSELLESSLSLGVKHNKQGNVHQVSNNLDRINNFIEEDFLAEYQLEESLINGNNSSEIDELSELLNQTIAAHAFKSNQEQKVEPLLDLDDLLTESFTSKNTTNHGLDEDNLGLSQIDELSQLLEESLNDVKESKVSFNVEQKELDQQFFNNFSEAEFLDEQVDIDSQDQDNKELDELSQLLANSLSLETSELSPSQIKDNSDLFNNFLEGEFLEEYQLQDELDQLDQGGEVYSEISDLDKFSKILEANLAHDLIEDNLAQTNQLDRLNLAKSDSSNHQITNQNIDELESLLEDSKTKFSYPLFELYDDLSDLEFLLEQPPIFEPMELNGEVKHLEYLINGLISLHLEFYDNFSELEDLLDQCANNQFNLDGINFEELMNVINTPAQRDKVQEQKIKSDQETAVSIKTEVKVKPVTKTSIQPMIVTEPKPVEKKPIVREDDEFGDLEALLDPDIVGGKTNAPQRQTNQPKKTNVFEQTMKVPVKQLDSLNNLMGELVVNRNSLEQDQEKLRLSLDKLLEQVQNLNDVGGRMQDLYERSLLESSLLAARQGVRHNYSSFGSSVNSNDQDYDPLEMDRFTGFHLLSAEMLELIVRVRESASDIQFLIDETDQVARTLRQVSTQMSEGLTKTRMLPFSHTAERFSTGLFRIKRKLKKEAKLIIEGREVLIDKMIQEHLHDPMTHLINNAMTHGIESPEERKTLGKESEGTITVRAFVQGNQTLISVSDDGAGINAAKVKAKAIEKKLITPQEAAKLSKSEIYDFLFNAGFSTADKVGELAGRGVGLDVVRTSLNEIRGSVSIESKVGQGTTFIIRLPLTLSISKALCCLSDHARIAFPMDGVEDMQDYLPNEIQTNPQGQKFVLWRDTYLPFQALSEFLSYNRQISRSSVYGKQASETISIVILRSAGKLLAVQVDQVLGEQEIVIKQIQGPIPKPPGIAGATVLGDGRIMPIADVLELIDISEGNLRKEAGGNLFKDSEVRPIEEAKSQPIVLIVDDSITVRELLSISFNKAGYQVAQAKNGLEAWEKLISGLPCDIIFCDVEMPQMDGLELLSNINNDENLKEIPVAMLTSRGAEKHRKIAAELGASGYFTKPYLEEVLLDGAQKMMDGEVLLAHSTRKPKPKVKPVTVSEAPKAQETELPIVHHAILQSSVKEKPKVLIIDDSVTVRELLSMTFKNAGYLVEQAKDGEDAWQKLNDNLDIDLAFCDIEMPRLNGLDLLSRLQQDERLSKLPVAMLTSRGAQKMKNIAAQRGARGYFVKPYMEEVLLDAAERLYKGEMLFNIEEETVEP